VVAVQQQLVAFLLEAEELVDNATEAAAKAASYLDSRDFGLHDLSITGAMGRVVEAVSAGAVVLFFALLVTIALCVAVIVRRHRRRCCCRRCLPAA
jgi:hypothetical protein